MLSYYRLKETIAAKQQQRADRIHELTPLYGSPLTQSEIEIVRTPVSQLVSEVNNGVVKPLDILHAYGKRTLKAHQDTNCLTEILFQDAEEQVKTCNTKGPLAGIPISVKDTVSIKGYDSTMGFACHAFKPIQRDSPIVQMLKEAGAILYCKTNIPMTLLSYESYNNLFGRTENPHKKGYAPGGSSGGEAALLAYGGSRIGIGTDVGGSVRVPSHFSGCYTVRSSYGRIPRAGNSAAIKGQDGITQIHSPMARTFEDLKYIFKVLIDLKPWEYDYTVHPIPWREVTLPSRMKVGVIYDDGIITPSPACARALQLTIDALKKQGHEIVEFSPPSPLEGLRIATQLIVADAGDMALSQIGAWEPYDKGVTWLFRVARLPRIIKKIYAWWYENVKGDHVTAFLLRDWNRKTMIEHMGLVWDREGYKSQYFRAWKDSGIDFLVTVPNATPALPHDGMYNAYGNVGYSTMFNLADYSAGVMPVTKVDKELDKLPESFDVSKLNAIARSTYKNYDPEKMHGLPVGVQIVGRRLEEEKVLKIMEHTIDALKDIGVEYKILNEI
ncbi:amidase signature domain-containing protein [Lipomyces japonicus]|uniref:amidase signature domain-containing protein n=1 Tax=Lipomyces japonicus TaxID=56871 RepID=UPI0034CFB8C4